MDFTLNWIKFIYIYMKKIQYMSVDTNSIAFHTSFFAVKAIFVASNIEMKNQ